MIGEGANDIACPHSKKGDGVRTWLPVPLVDVVLRSMHNVGINFFSDFVYATATTCQLC